MQPTSTAEVDEGDPGQHLEGYTCLGLGTIVERGRPEIDMRLTYVKLSGEPSGGGDAGDRRTGLDRCGRVVGQRWLDGSDDDTAL